MSWQRFFQYDGNVEQISIPTRGFNPRRRSVVKGIFLTFSLFIKVFEVLQFVKKGYSHPESSQAFQFGRTAASRSFRSIVQSRVVLTQAQMAFVHTPPCVLPLCFTFPLALEHIRTATSTPTLEHSSAQAYKTDPFTQHRHTSSYTQNHTPELACHNTRVCAQFHAHPQLHSHILRKP